MVRDGSFYVVQSFMIKELSLKGNELVVYAIIYGFSQTDNQFFTGSLQYLADWTNSTKQGVLKNIKSLLEKDLIVKRERFSNNVKYCEYATKFNTMQQSLTGGIKQSLTGMQQSLTGGIKQSLTNNIDINNITNNIDINNIKEKTVGSCEPRVSLSKKLDSMIKEFTDDEDLRETLLSFIEMRKAIKKPVTEQAMRLLLKKLTSYTFIVSDQIKILETSIQNSWTGIFELKQEKQFSNSQTKRQDIDRQLDEMLKGCM
jgi:DNA-binding MarR family transcriptional regulator